ncbi:uncharacterized protein LOC133927771 [Phragmites australis]|uniref:uncharacterized protein LOC133927771 n=1 Tax=Phragmites australis TaxID=29695 RepID=UPI002D77F9E9|nr:uncharacterized protein LOC133927771 [Phragmites australis]
MSWAGLSHKKATCPGSLARAALLLQTTELHNSYTWLWSAEAIWPTRRRSRTIVASAVSALVFCFVRGAFVRTGGNSAAVRARGGGGGNERAPAGRGDAGATRGRERKRHFPCWWASEFEVATEMETEPWRWRWRSTTLYIDDFIFYWKFYSRFAAFPVCHGNCSR